MSVKVRNKDEIPAFTPSFKINMWLPNPKTWKPESTPITVHMDEPTISSKELKFYATIPKHMYDVVSVMDGNYIKSYRGNLWRMDKEHWDKIARVTFGAQNEKLKKIIENNTLEGLIKDMCTIGSDAMAAHYFALLKNGELEGHEKWIFIRFRSSTHGRKSSYCHAHLGTRVSISFQWCIAFKVQKEGMMGQKYDMWHSGESYKNMGGVDGFAYHGPQRHSESELGEFLKVPWTKEREEFLHQVEFSMRELEGKLKGFLGDLTVEKLDQLMVDSKNLLEYMPK